MPAVLLAATKAPTSHPLWHYLVIPAIGVVLFACIFVSDLIRGVGRDQGDSPDDRR
jgi:hypothetical protein